MFDSLTQRIWEHVQEIDWKLRHFDLNEKDWVSCPIHSLSLVPSRDWIFREVQGKSAEGAKEIIIRAFAPAGIKAVIQKQLLTMSPVIGESLGGFIDRMVSQMTHASPDKGLLFENVKSVLTLSPSVGPLV